MGMVGGMVILWHHDSICLTDWRENCFSLSASFTIMESGGKGTLSNIHGLSAFPHKPAFLEFLSWIKGQIDDSTWIVGMDFNLRTSLGENKGGKRSMDKL